MPQIWYVVEHGRFWVSEATCCTELPRDAIASILREQNWDIYNPGEVVFRCDNQQCLN